MERDTRRHRSQWRGCHTFNDIICDGDQAGNPKRSGGLKMGQTYYYYYELDGSMETHDPTVPTTNACPYLPGQTVNTLEVPLEHTLLRNRSASMNSLRATDFKTMDPKDKFMTPRPAPPVPSLPDLRLGSAPAMSLVYKRSARSLSPAPRWTGAARRFFGRKKGCYQDSDAGSETEVESQYGEESKHFDEPPRSNTPSGSVRSRDMSPESLRRFLLSDDLPQTPPVVEPTPKLSIPDEIVEENEDDDNFATSAVSETAPFTVLSPPPFQRSISSSSFEANKNKSTATIVPVDSTQEDNVIEPVDVRPEAVDIKLDLRSHFSFSTTSSSLVSPASPRSTESRDLSQYSFFDESDDESEDVFSISDEPFSIQGARRSNDESRSIPKHIHSPITGYSLPHPTTHSDKPISRSRISTAPLGSPDLVARLDSGVSISNANLLSRSGVDAGLEDLVTDMGWMADVIQPKYI
ncbi:hypothetical protein F4820DRAFT_457581 [Hypoxylon rubiginosum]|uniref:Uncharacterized protein n=1 Tax=Hypoxylon rubiginosum TaxID=110542 RepID=A0ACB9Z5U6_9PEZI|nr:hypothetical protein F4820DRAFT_457581 [Hypoxylon rubiginosum]